MVFFYQHCQFSSVPYKLVYLKLDLKLEFTMEKINKENYAKKKKNDREKRRFNIVEDG